MKVENCAFSGLKIFPGHGKVFVRSDSRFFKFTTGKSESLFLQRKNPRRLTWTQLYRRMHKKGINEEQAKKRIRRNVKSQRGIVGASLEVIKERQNQRPEVRAAQRQQDLEKHKEKKRITESEKKALKAKAAATAARGQIASVKKTQQPVKSTKQKAGPR